MVTHVAKGVASTGATVKIFQFPETMSADILTKIKAPPKNTDHPIVTTDDLVSSDGIIFGFPTRYGAPPAQFKNFWDTTGGLWAKGALVGKPYSHIFSTGTQAGGQETTAMTSLPNFVHHGMVHVPIGYSSPLLFNMDEVHGGSPWGAGTLAGPTGARQPTKLETDVAEHQGSYFANFVTALATGKKAILEGKAKL